MSKSDFSNIENAMRCERPDRDIPTDDLEKTEYAFGVESYDFKPDYGLGSESDVEPYPEVSRMADDESVIMRDTPAS